MKTKIISLSILFFGIMSTASAQTQTHAMNGNPTSHTSTGTDGNGKPVTMTMISCDNSTTKDCFSLTLDEYVDLRSPALEYFPGKIAILKYNREVTKGILTRMQIENIADTKQFTFEFQQ